MKGLNVVVKVIAALAAVAGIAYLIATYGDKVVAWAKKLLNSCPCCDGTCTCACTEADIAEEEPAEEAEVVSVDVAEEAEEVAEPIVDETSPMAEEADFEG